MGVVVVIGNGNGSGSPSDDLECLIDVFSLNALNSLQFFLDLAGQFPAPGVFGQVGDELDSVENGGGVVIEQSFNIGEGTVVEDLDLTLVELRQRAEQ